MSSNNNLNEEEEILFFYEDPKSFDEKNLYEVNRAPWFYHLINVLGLTKDNFMEIKHMVEDKKNNILNLINYKSYTDNYLKKNDTMKNMLCAYLYSCKTSLYEYSKNINSEQNIHFVFTFGNITADLDSVCSSIIYSFFLFIWYSLKTNLIGKKKDDPLMFFIPVINIKKNDMKLKILIIWWLEKCGIENPEELLIFNDDLNLLEVLKNDTKYDTCLVDFNKSENNCVYNINNIKSIIDHHILNEEMKNKKITKSVFPIYVCSCMVIIAYFYKYSSEFLGISLLNRDIMWLIYGTMLKDSNNFPKDDFRKRWIQSDLNIYLSMKKYFRIPDIMDIYITQKFNNIRFSIDLKKFGIENLLFVDYKDYNYDIQGKKFTIRICSLDFSVESILSHENVDTLVNKMCELCEENKFAAFILMGSYMINYVFHKDIGLLFFNEDITKDKLLTALIANQDINLCEKGFKKITCKNESRNIDLFHEKKIEEKRKKQYEEEKEIIEQKKKIYEEKRKIKFEKYKVEKMKKKLIEREKYNKENIEYNYITIFNYFNYLMNNRKHYDIYFSFHDLYISPMRLYYFINMKIDEIYYLGKAKIIFIKYMFISKIIYL
ncbi:hypothetical protein PFUGPA_03522 [Plasmodium falciparum Palo Alto/Uganda]|uniref:Exopolyphosphatase n=2 Tax=Plasmodium falciparum TaxID=5833 RepID=W4IUG6_PLAFP|nr:hypothetical protein PFUGPA_03522 [Plasmodium falciparum Palo Alto/Uganda]